jgi:hypothetical protein
MSKEKICNLQYILNHIRAFLAKHKPMRAYFKSVMLRNLSKLHKAVILGGLRCVKAKAISMYDNNNTAHLLVSPCFFAAERGTHERH